MRPSPRSTLHRIGSTVFGGAVLWAALASPTAAQETYNLVLETAPVQQVSQLSNFAVPESLAGARATVFYADGSSSSTLFTGISTGFGNIGQASVAGRFDLIANSGDGGTTVGMFINNLTSNLTLTGFRIDGLGDGAGFAAFDRNFGPTLTDTGTAGSAGGTTLFFNLGNMSASLKREYAFTITYSNPIGLNGAAPVGDLYRSVQADIRFFTFGGLPGTSNFGGTFSTLKFSTDIDTVTYVAAVPEPEQGAMLLAGLLAVGFAARRRKAGATPPLPPKG